MKKTSQRVRKIHKQCVVSLDVDELITNDSIIEYTVQSGETLYSISKRFMVPMEVLLTRNNLSTTALKPNQIITIPLKREMKIKPRTHILYIPDSTKQISNQNIPFKVSILKDNNIIDSKWITGDSKKPIVFYNNEANYVAINPIIGLPELSKLNNWRSINNTFIGKPLSIRLFKDSEDPTKNQILVNPTGFYNLYDGASFGARFHNKTLQPRYFTYIIDPMYSSIEKTLVGSIMTDYKYYNDFRSNYLTQFSFLFLICIKKSIS